MATGTGDGRWDDDRPPVRVGFVGLEHPHVYGIAASLQQAGALLTSVSAGSAEAAATFAGVFEGVGVRDSAPAVFGDPEIDVVVVVDIPRDRAVMAAHAMEAGKHVVVAKPAALTDHDVRLLRTTQARTRRVCAVYLSERLEDRSTLRASRLVADGAIGSVVHVGGSGPHRLGLSKRPGWFLDPTQAGGVLTDLATHQIDQFLHFSALTDAAADVEIITSVVANHAHPEHPALEDHGEVHLRRGAITGFARVDWMTPAGLPTWGDVRLFIHGTEGTIELRKNVDIGGQTGGDHLLLVDGSGVHRVDCANEPLVFADGFLADVRAGEPRNIDQGHHLKVCELAVAAQQRATRLGHLARSETP